ncbi:hypothetical protein A3Q56_06600 [Intoshia linei]|uniref:Uncharacterized protein n=1 Tax=Intoshia linei TaxID=1819745 RepID=A0A177AVY5_9BILA|nr:hypothetical protein A3Q56_06600 [Intoshia linei]
MDACKLLIPYRGKIVKIKGIFESIYDDNLSCEEYLATLNPFEWKKQDHYRIFDLHHLRYNASDKQIKDAYRKTVLKYHPDKSEITGLDPDEMSKTFRCVTEAYKILLTPKLRKSYDSIDFIIDDSIPHFNPECDDFFKVFREVISNNTRWSTTVSPHMYLGDIYQCKTDVYKFYDFWKNFKSWREFSYMDEQSKEDSNLDKYEKKCIDKENKAKRAKLKTAETNRINRLIDTLMKYDPRIKIFEKQDKLRKSKLSKERKHAKYLEKMAMFQNTHTPLKDTPKKIEEKIHINRKNHINQTRKNLKKKLENIFEKNNYYFKNGDDKIKNMKNASLIINSFDDVDELNELIENISKLSIEKARIIFQRCSDKVKTKITDEKSHVQVVPKANEKVKKQPWCLAEQKILEQGLKQYPRTDTDRFIKISQMCFNRTPHECKQRFEELREMLKKRKNGIVKKKK